MAGPIPSIPNETFATQHYKGLNGKEVSLLEDACTKLDFIDRAQRSGLAGSDVFAFIPEKREMLVYFFPSFGPDGNRSLQDDRKVGPTFKGVYDSESKLYDKYIKTIFEITPKVRR